MIMVLQLINMGEYDSAREQFLSVIRDTDNKIVRENNKKAYRGIALSYYAEGTYDQAKAYLELALKNKELSSLNRDLNAYLAECEMYLGDYEKSLKTWNALIDDLGGKKKKSYGAYYLGRAKLQAVRVMLIKLQRIIIHAYRLIRAVIPHTLDFILCR